MRSYRAYWPAGLRCEMRANLFANPRENPPLKCGLQRGRDNRYEEEGGGGELIPNPRQKHRERRLPNL